MGGGNGGGTGSSERVNRVVLGHRVLPISSLYHWCWRVSMSISYVSLFPSLPWHLCRFRVAIVVVVVVS